MISLFHNSIHTLHNFSWLSFRNCKRCYLVIIIIIIIIIISIIIIIIIIITIIITISYYYYYFGCVHTNPDIFENPYILHEYGVFPVPLGQFTWVTYPR